MRAIILAAGRGSRMGSLTADKPKCLVEIYGRPLVEWQIEALRAAGLEHIGIVRGFEGQLLDSWNVTFFENRRWASTNMVQSLLSADDWLSNHDCIVSYSDILYHTRIVSRLRHTAGPVSITYDRQWLKLWQKRFKDPLTDAESFQVDERGELIEIGRRVKCLEQIRGQYMGLLRFSPEGWASIKTVLFEQPVAVRDSIDVTGLLRLAIKAGLRINTVSVDGRWCEVDSEADLGLYESMLKNGQKWSHDWRTTDELCE